MIREERGLPDAQAVALAAPAKLNLSLAVLGRRADGYHELAGVMVLLELADRLLVVPGCSGMRLEGRTEGVPVAPADNLAWRGLLAGMGDEPLLSCLEVEKRIPAAAGLGGGSSDAAAAWRLGRSLATPGGTAAPAVAPGVPPAETGRLLGLGADVPFFAAATPAAYVSGAGERVEPLPPPVPAPEVLLVLPPFRLATAEVFSSLREAEWSREAPPREVRAGPNDLLAAARRLRPELDAVVEGVRACGLEPHLTGSGPTLFVLSDDAARLTAAAGRLGERRLETIRTRLAVRAASIEAIGERRSDAEPEPEQEVP